MSKSVIIIGGGLSGLASAVFLCEAGYNIRIYESSPKWGGRTYSYYDKDKEIFIDNGQHILAGWYENTFNYLKKIGTFNLLKFQDNLKLDFFTQDKNHLKFRCGNLPGIYSLLQGVFSFKGFNFNDKLKFLKIKKVLNNEKYSSEYLRSISVRKLLDDLNQTDNLYKFFWNPLILASFNTIPENVSADLFVKLIKKGTENKKNMSIILSDVTLNELFIDSAVNFLKKKSVKLNLNLGVERIEIENNSVKYIEFTDGSKEKADYYVSAVPFFSYSKLFDKIKNSEYICNTGELKSSTIISVHLFLKEDLNTDNFNEMSGLIDTTVQWIFMKNKKHMCIVISAADYIENNLTNKDNEEIIKICYRDLKSCLNGFDENNVKDFKIIKEKRATFLPEVGSEMFRQNQKSNIDNLFVEGDWTDTGYPATIEGAIKSAKICSDLILNN